jgi:hypothetical protein
MVGGSDRFIEITRSCCPLTIATKFCPTKCTSSSSKRENIVLHLAFKLNSAPAAAETWDLKVLLLKIKE